MQRNKPGLADLKRLRQHTEAPGAAPEPTKPGRVARKRSPFLPPSTQNAATPKVGSRQAPAQAERVDASRHAGQQRGRLAGAPLPTTAPSHASAALLSEDDRKLFRSAVRYVDKLRDPGRVLLPPLALAQPLILQERRKRATGEAQAARQLTALAEPAADPSRKSPSPRRLSDAYASASSHENDSRYLKPGHGTDILRDLQRGKWSIGASLDLHGSTLEDARDRFERFLTSCLAHEVKCVRIVHGKGYGSPNGDAVLKTTVRRWLTQVDEVIGYAECAEPDGGSGAVQVLLR